MWEQRSTLNSLVPRDSRKVIPLGHWFSRKQWGTFRGSLMVLFLNHKTVMEWCVCLGSMKWWSPKVTGMVQLRGSLFNPELRLLAVFVFSPCVTWAFCRFCNFFLYHKIIFIEIYAKLRILQYSHIQKNTCIAKIPLHTNRVPHWKVFKPVSSHLPKTVR